MRPAHILLIITGFFWTAGVQAEHVESWRGELVGWCSPKIPERIVAPICYGFIMATLDLLHDGHLIVQRKKEYPRWVCAKAKTHEYSVRQVRDLIVARGGNNLKYLVHNHAHDLVVDVLMEAGVAQGQACEGKIVDKSDRASD